MVMVAAVRSRRQGARIHDADGEGDVTGVFSEVPLVTPAESQVALLEMVNETGADPDALVTCKV